MNTLCTIKGKWLNRVSSPLSILPILHELSRIHWVCVINIYIYLWTNGQRPAMPNYDIHYDNK